MYSVNGRYNRHLYEARRCPGGVHNHSWIKHLLDRGIKPELILLESTCNDPDFWETFYIAYFKSVGCRLTNHAVGGAKRGGYHHSKEHKERMRRLFKGRKPWNTGKKLTAEQKKNRFAPANFKKLSKESLARRVLNQQITKAKKSKASFETIQFIRSNKSKYTQSELGRMFKLRQDYISDVQNYKIRKLN